MERRWKVLAVVSVAVFMASLDLFIVNVAFPELARDFRGTSVAGLSWVLNAYAIVFAALLVPAGRLADRVGRRRMFLLGLGGFVVGSAACGLAPSVETLVAARVVQAAGAAALMPTSLALLLPEFEVRDRAVAIGIWGAVGGIAAAAGPPLGGVLVEGSWRLVFLVNVPIAIGAAVVGARLLRESRDEAPGPWPDWAGTAALTLGIGTLALALVEAPDWGWGSAATLGTLGASLAGLVALVLRSRVHPSPVVDLEMLRVRSFALAGVAMLLFGAAFAAMLLGTVLFTTGVWGDSVLRAGLSIAPGPLMAAVLAVGSGRLSARVAPSRLAAIGCSLFAAGGAWWLWRLDDVPAYVTAMLPGLLLAGAGVGLTIAPLSGTAVSSLPPARFATGSAVVTMARQIGSVLGVAVLVALLGTPASAADFQGGWVLLIVAAGLGAAAALAIGPLRAPVPAAAAAAPVAEGAA